VKEAVSAKPVLQNSQTTSPIHETREKHVFSLNFSKFISVKREIKQSSPVFSPVWMVLILMASYRSTYIHSSATLLQNVTALHVIAYAMSSER
jgi:hypothetical protein